MKIEYIKKAIQHIHIKILSWRRKKQLKKISLKVRSTSMQVNAEFSKIERDPKE